MKAEEMRIIAKNKVEIQKKEEDKIANEFWEEIKDELFEAIKNEAVDGKFELYISNEMKLYKKKVKGVDLDYSWIDCKYIRNKVENELKLLGYEFNCYFTFIYGLTISWA